MPWRFPRRLRDCGGGGDESPSEAEKADDIAILNTALGYELTAVDAYTHALPLLRGATLDTVRRFRAQEQEHVDAITKALRGLGGRADPEPADARARHRGTKRDNTLLTCGRRSHPRLRLVSAAIAEDMSAVANLTATWPRALLTSIAANEAQQLAVLRQALGAEPCPGGIRERRRLPPGMRAPVGDDPRVTAPLYAIGRFCSRHHWPVIGLWLIAAVALVDRRPGLRQQDQRQPHPARHRLHRRHQPAGGQPPAAGLRQQPAGVRARPEAAKLTESRYASAIDQTRQAPATRRPTSTRPSTRSAPPAPPSSAETAPSPTSPSSSASARAN